MSNAPVQVVVVDDEEPLRNLVRQYLEREGFQVRTVSDGLAALDLIRREAPAVVVLDLMLPGLDGLEVCRRLRAFSDAYVLMLTAKAEEIDRIVGLEVGADDYLTKPVSPRELVARVRAMLRRPRTGGPAAPPEAPPPQPLGDLVIDLTRREVRRDDAVLSLTALEFSLLTSLAADPGRVFTRSQLL
jgi:DNA-binding response OmpR family regulator